MFYPKQMSITMIAQKRTEYFALLLAFFLTEKCLHYII